MPTWDDRIDEAARQLTEGEPAPGFRARVLSRLDDARPARVWTRGWVLAPAAAAAVALALAAIVQLRQPDRVAPSPAMKQQLTTSTPATVSGGGPPAFAPKALRRARRSSLETLASGGGKGPPYPSGGAIADAGGLEGPPYQIDVDDFAPPELVVDALDIPPATIEPLRVEVLEELQIPASDALDIAPLESGQ